MPFNTATANNILSWAFGKSSLASKSTIYLGLCTNDPEADGGTFTELSGGGYARIPIAKLGDTYPDVIGSASSRAITNAKQIAWTKATANWSAVNGFGLFDALTGGTPFYYGKLDLTEAQEAAGGVAVEAGAVMLFDPGALKISFTTTDEASA